MIEREKKGRHIKKQRKNQGSAIIEITMLIPVYLGVFYLYIILFLFLIECGFLVQGMLEYMYNVETTFKVQEELDNFTMRQQGNIKVIRGSIHKVFQMDLEFKGNTEVPTQKIRRWHIAINTVS